MAVSDDCECDALVSLVKSHVEGAALIRHHGRELAFSLPMEQVANFSSKVNFILDTLVHSVYKC